MLVSVFVENGGYSYLGSISVASKYDPADYSTVHILYMRGKAGLTFMNFDISFHLQRMRCAGFINTFGEFRVFRGQFEAIWCLYAFTSVHFTQPSHYHTDELACRCRIFPTASRIIKIFSSFPAPCLVLLGYSSRYGTTCVLGAKTDVEVGTQTQ